MAWWSRRSQGEPLPPPGVAAVRVPLDGLTAVEASEREATWRSADGGLVTLQVLDELDLAADPPPRALQAYFRRLAESRQAGLVEADRVPWRRGQAFLGIYKKSERTGFIFTAFLCMPMPRASLVWVAANRERGTTGVREAIVTASMLERGEMTIEWFKENWSQDPYDPDYRARGRVESRTLRYYSDDVRFDAIVPDHPLSRVRATIRHLCADVDVDAEAFGLARAGA